MNERARAYLAKHAELKLIDGVSELTLSLDKLQGFLDLLGPSDLLANSPQGRFYEKLQRLYTAQATWVHTIQDKVAQHDLEVAQKIVLDQSSPHTDE
jgi:hypothetical protein